MKSSFLSYIAYIPRNLFIVIIYFYKFFISPILPKSCRFPITCSEYAIISLKQYGFFKGIYRAIKRILHCHPFCDDYKD